MKIKAWHGAVMGGATVAIILTAYMLGMFSGFFPNPTPTPGPAVLFKGQISTQGSAVPTYGVMNVVDPSGISKGSPTVAAGAFTTGAPIVSDASYWFFYNGTSLWYPNSWFFKVPAWTSPTNTLPTANDYVTVSPGGNGFELGVIAAAWSDSISDGVATATMSNGGSTQTTAFSAVHGVTKTYTFTSLVSSTYATRYPNGITNPGYLSSGAVNSYVVIITNSTTAYAVNAGTITVSLAASTLFFVPMPTVKSTANPGTASASIQIVFPNAPAAGYYHFSFQVYGVWYDTAANLQNSKGISTGPSGWTIGTSYVENGVITMTS